MTKMIIDKIKHFPMNFLLMFIKIENKWPYKEFVYLLELGSPPTIDHY